jgi:hypothetical protein
MLSSHERSERSTTTSRGSGAIGCVVARQQRAHATVADLVKYNAIRAVDVVAPDICPIERWTVDLLTESRKAVCRPVCSKHLQTTS